MNQTTTQPANDTADLINELVEQLVHSYLADKRIHHLNATFMPNRAKTIEIVELLRRLLFPGFFDGYRLTIDNIRFHAGDLLVRVHELLHDQVKQALLYDRTCGQGMSPQEAEHECDACAWRITADFLRTLPDVRQLLATDVQATFDGDPAAVSTDETIFCYPGIDAIFIHRVAHELYKLNVPLLARIMTEYAHSETGIDIHPGATIDQSFCIDHGTGVVIGETCRIGKRVKIYQGVTLGALSTKGGQAWRGRQRHPIIEDDVTIYGGAIILGGETVIGEGSTIGGSVFITSSIPPWHNVSMKLGELKITAKRKPGKKNARMENPDGE